MGVKTFEDVVLLPILVDIRDTFDVNLEESRVLLLRLVMRLDFKSFAELDISKSLFKPIVDPLMAELGSNSVLVITLPLPTIGLTSVIVFVKGVVELKLDDVRHGVVRHGEPILFGVASMRLVKSGLVVKLVIFV